MKPTVSVIIPTYNRAKLLKKAIQSVLDQTYQNFEIIVVDDASSKNMGEVVKSFKNERVRYIRHKENKGLAAARNTGIKNAKGKYIALLDDDDLWLSDKLKKQIEVFKKASSEVGVVYTQLVKINGMQEIYIPSPGIEQKEGWIHNHFLRENFVGTSNTVLKKECFDKAGMFDEALHNLEDWECWIRVSKYFKFKYINEPLTKQYCLTDSLSSNEITHIESVIFILKKHLADIKKNRKLLGRYYTYIGLFLFRIGRKINAIPYFLRATIVDPIGFSKRAIFHIFKKALREF